ncbi:hypothetical protein DFJ58DRAFT_917738 [Suillus subalutaceus]|nr:uncharacterized protein DFJ58DRAFT_917738 [Suillus subalutaceus]KAG1836218.1 hypothetical protein DFJ58DRAFT_917738 [Suillus subalutaceus]
MEELTFKSDMSFFWATTRNCGTKFQTTNDTQHQKLRGIQNEWQGRALDGDFAEYIVYHQKKLYKIKNLTDEESTLLEPAACAIHGLDKLIPPVGIELGRRNPDAQWQKLKDDNPYGFDVVVEATGAEKIADMSIGYVRRGARSLATSKIFGDEITIIGSFSQMYCFPRAVAYLDSGKVKVKGMATDAFKLEDYQLA